MVITYYGVSCFKIQSGDNILAFDPPSKKSGFKTPRFQADIVFVSHNHDKHNGFENISPKEGRDEPLLINGPGEYEIAGIHIKGIRTFHDSQQGKKHGLNTTFVLNLENITICHLGDFGEKELRPEVLEVLAGVDIFFVSIGGGEVIDFDKAVDLINQIESKIIIPMHYFTNDMKQDKKKLTEFLKEMGQEKVKSLERLSFKKKDVTDKKGEVVVLQPLIN